MMKFGGENFKVAIDTGIATDGIGKQCPGAINQFLGEHPVIAGREIKAERFNILAVNLITVDDCREGVGDHFQQVVAEAFDFAEIGTETAVSGDDGG